MNIIKWWIDLPFQNKRLDELASPDSLVGLSHKR